MWRFFLEMEAIYSYHLKEKSKFHSKYLWENWQTALRFLSLKKNFHKNFSMWKVIIKWLFVTNLFDLDTNRKSFLEQIFYTRQVLLMKLTKNLVTIPVSLWTRYLICKIICVRRFALTWSSLPLHPHPVCVNVIIE